MIKPVKDFFSNISDSAFTTILICLSLVLGAFARYAYLDMKDIFPLGDGGLFAAMIDAVRVNHYWLPETVRYNSFDIPFAYPPLGFYFAIAASEIFGISTLSTLRLLPLAFNFLTIAAFVPLASRLLKDRLDLLACSVVFPLVFEVYQWTIKGGGLTRSPGFFFMVTTLYFFLLHQQAAKPRELILTVISLSAAIMSHLEWGLIAIASIFAYLLTGNIQQWRNHLRVLLVLGGGSALLTLPWWGTVVARFGLKPFLLAGQIARPSRFFDIPLDASIFSVHITPAVDGFIPWLVMIGIAAALIKKDFFFPVWLLFVYMADARNIPKSGIVPLTFLIVIGLRGVDSLLSYLFSLIPPRRALSISPVSFLCLLALIVSGFILDENKTLLRPIKRSDRAAMEFIADAAPRDARFVVVTQYNWFEADSAEWFPYLTERQSLTTPQGLEWVSPLEFGKRVVRANRLAILAQNEQMGIKTTPIYEYVETNFEGYGYVAVFVKGVTRDFGGFKDTGRYEVAYAEKDVLILELLVVR